MGMISACMDGIRQRWGAREERGWAGAFPSPAGNGLDWEGVRLEARDLAEGALLELVLDLEGREEGRCLARRDGTFLREPSGPNWARRILVEAVAEWRLQAA